MFDYEGETTHKMSSIFRILDPVVSLQEVPGEISLIFQITGCPHRCPGCHSPELWPSNGSRFDLERFTLEIERYRGLFTCVCFFGGEWLPGELLIYLNFARERGLKTCLYSGATEVHSSLYPALNYLKLGPWVEALGGLDKNTTNQVFLDLDKKSNLNYLFQRN